MIPALARSERRPGDRTQTSGQALCERLRPDPSQSGGETARIGRKLTIGNPRLVEKQPSRVLAQVRICSKAGKLLHKIVTRVDLQHGPCRRPATPRGCQQLLELSVHSVFGRNQACRAFGESLGGPHVRHLVLEHLLHELDEAGNLIGRGGGRRIAFGQRYEPEIGRALRHGLEGLPFEVQSRGRTVLFDLGIGL